MDECNKYRQIIINHKLIDNDIENYEILVPLRNIFGNSIPDERDIAFVAEDKVTPLEFDICPHDAGYDCKVDIPFVSKDKDTIFYVYWKEGD